jgi:hypothetical protein
MKQKEADIVKLLLFDWEADPEKLRKLCEAIQSMVDNDESVTFTPITNLEFNPTKKNSITIDKKGDIKC